MTEHTSNYQALLKSIKANQQIALDYIKLSIPPNVLERFDLSSIAQLPTTYVPEELEKSLSDIVYTCRNASGTDNVKISLLILHTSEVNKYAPIQIGSYIFSAMLKQVGEGEKPSLFIPVLLVNSNARWEHRTLSSLFDSQEAELLTYLPDYQYLLHNV